LKELKKGRKGKTRWIVRCPKCFSDRNDLYLGGGISTQVRKCMNCGYIGGAFIKVEGEWNPEET
jgi:hypothetical protein